MEKSIPSKRSIETVHLNCYLCGSSENVLVASGGDREYYTTDDVFHVVECSKCGLGFLNPRPTVAELDTIYPPDYYSYNMDADPADLGLALQLRHKVHGRRIRSLLRHLDNRPQIDLLDVGCGDGVDALPVQARRYRRASARSASTSTKRYVSGSIARSYGLLRTFRGRTGQPAVRRHQPVKRDRARYRSRWCRQKGIRLVERRWHPDPGNAEQPVVGCPVV